MSATAAPSSRSTQASPRKATIVAVGTRGDVQPYIALGRGLADAGWEVRLATHEEFRGLTSEWDLPYARIGVSPRQIIEDGIAESWLSSGRNPIRFLTELSRVVGPQVESLFEDCLESCADTDLVLYSPMAFPAYHVANYHRTPCIAALHVPMARTDEFPNVAGIPLPFSVGRIGNRISHALMEQAYWRPFAGMVNRWRRQHGLPSISRLGLHHHLRREQHQVILGYSEHILPLPHDWPPELMHVTGYWQLPEPDGYTPPAHVADFLNAGPPPVYIGFGSMRPTDPDRMTRTILDAVRAAGARAILEPSWDGLEAAGVPDEVLVVRGVPHAWLLPHVAAAVHHGGAGTTGATLRAGLPTIVCPFFGDQFFWGSRVQAIGAGPKPIPQKRLTAARLARAVSTALTDPAMRRRASALGDLIRGEDGVARAVEVLDRFASRVGRSRV
jgi:UDP:flavonoid glycosyltransferase YjiC (YdhE family)